MLYKFLFLFCVIHKSGNIINFPHGINISLSWLLFGYGHWAYIEHVFVELFIVAFKQKSMYSQIYTVLLSHVCTMVQ